MYVFHMHVANACINVYFYLMSNTFKKAKYNYKVQTGNLK